MDYKTCFAGKKILLAEDDTTNQEMMKDILGGMQCQIEIAKDGNEAVTKFSQGSFDLILMDIRMPNKDGIQATREIRALEKGNKKIPILALTASTLNSERESIISAGVDDFLQKPINLEELRKKMAQHLLGST